MKTAAPWHIPDVPRVRVAQAVEIDWDRTLGQVPPSLQRLYKVAAPYEGVDVKALEAKSKLAVKDGGSFSPFDELKLQLANKNGSRAPAIFDKITSDYHNYQSDDPSEQLTYPDAPGLLHRVDGSGAPYMVVTYGVSKPWQALKIAGGGYKGYYRALPEKRKGPYFQGLQQPSGTFDFGAIEDGRLVAILEAEALACVDDKTISFADSPNNFTGILLRRPEEEILPSQQGEWPEELTVPSLGYLAMKDALLTRLDQKLPDEAAMMPEPQTIYVPLNEVPDYLTSLD